MGMAYQKMFLYLDYKLLVVAYEAFVVQLVLQLLVRIQN